MFEVLGISFHLYGLLVGFAIFSGFWVAERVKNEFEKQGRKIGEFEVWDGLWWVVIPAIALGRIYHVIGEWDYYRSNILLILKIWEGGMGIIGAIIGGAMGAWIYAKKRRIKLLNMLDLAAFSLPIGQAIGRWGNYFNKELYGLPTNVFWKMYIPFKYRLEQVKSYEYFHPLFFYEFVWSLIIFGILYFLLKRKSKQLISGSYFSIYLIMYGVGRYVLEGLRIEHWILHRVDMAKLVSILSICVGLLIYFRKRLLNLF
jgi:phosphatidylglycerol:prolipoprotein diacylglycerol transferase